MHAPVELSFRRAQISLCDWTAPFLADHQHFSNPAERAITWGS